MKRDQKTSAEQVMLKLRQIEVQTAQGQEFGVGLQGGGDIRAELNRWRKGVRRLTPWTGLLGEGHSRLI